MTIRKLMKSYMVLDSSNETDLANQVNSAMGYGWRPVGGVSVTWVPRGDSSYMLYSQATCRTWWYCFLIKLGLVGSNDN